MLENGADRGRGVELSPGRVFKVGRDARCDLVLEDDQVSRLHCKVKEFKGAWYIRDLESTNGILVNEQPVTQAELKFGDRVQVGAAVMTFLAESLEQLKKVKTLGGYQLLQRIGRGGMGTVYRAIQVSLNREVALKVLSPHLVKDSTFVDQFFREARAAGQLNHPHIVQVYDVGHEGNTYFYSMEYVAGGSLEERLREEGVVPPEEAIAMVHQAALALEFAESRQIVHRDLKPDNLMLTDDGQIKIADLGLALSLKEGAALAGQPILGTPHFISPEQALRREVDIRSDIYSLGATFYRMLSGRTVHQGETPEEIIRKVVREEATPLREVAPDVSEKVAHVVQKMIQRLPSERHASATELREELEALLSRRGRTVVLWSAVGVAAAAVAVSVTLALRGPATEIIVRETEDLESRAAAFEAKSALEKRELELEAVRAYLQLVRASPSPVQELANLKQWLALYDYLPIPERGEAEQRQQQLEIQEEQRQRRWDQGQQRMQALWASFDPQLQSALDESRYHDALALWQSTDRLEELDEDLRTVFLSEREDRRSRIEEAVRTSQDAWQQKVEGFAAEEDSRSLLEQLGEARDACGEIPPEWNGPAVDLAREHRQWLIAKVAELESAWSERQAEIASHDRRILSSAWGGDFQSRLHSLDFVGAAEHLESSAESMNGAPFRPPLEHHAIQLRRTAKLLQEVLQKLNRGELAQAPRIPLPEGDFAELVGWESDPGRVRLQLPGSRGGSVTRWQGHEVLANPGALEGTLCRSLVLSEPDLESVLEVMTLLEVAGSLRSLDSVFRALETYNPEQGWSSLGAGVAESIKLPESIIPRILDAAMERHPSWRPTLQRIAKDHRRERAILEEFWQGMAPFLDQEGNWGQAAATFTRILRDKSDSLVVRLLLRVLDRRASFPVIAMSVPERSPTEAK